ncbi:acetyl-CoA carboxylase carboxyl transferase subunit alpha [Candidatus Aerophobetes bacterium]|uniref:Acetyl-coenzyme A carboxylase carboxyl transferase subunit alpha n=1 Tax=Aerophobetes bacterium TaxID=2030807 RepID=A0A2A4X779_UNCAE|nr:MAG: acetyl-CoA carboxylase carboxyl transferase subunit alpha [Candidatus Aerophobetes bacterium]
MLSHEKQIFDCEDTIKQLREQNQENGIWSDDELAKLEEKLTSLKEKVYSDLSRWERVAISRHPKRPKSVDYIKAISDEFTEIFGDRLYRDDPAIITGFAVIEGRKFVVIAQEKGFDTESRLYRNFGMPHPEGFRKALRAMKLAEKFSLPILSLVDTPGAFPGLAAEERGQGSAIAVNLLEMSKLGTPIIVVLIGEGCSGGALGIAVGDVVGMLEHSYYSVISPEGCASILWRDGAMNEKAATALKMHAEDLIGYGIIDTILDEPQGGAHHDTEVVFSNVKAFVLEQETRLQQYSVEELLNQRYDRFRKFGEFKE